MTKTNKHAKTDKKKIELSTKQKIGALLIAMSLLIFGLTYYKVVGSEIHYAFKQLDKQETQQKDSAVASKTDISPQDLERIYSVSFDNYNFVVFIPKIDANAIIIKDVSPYDYTEYQKALEKGVAHAKGTVMPGENGNTFLFAHSAVNFYEDRNVNVYFYLLPKLEVGDPIYLIYKDKVYSYYVSDNEIVDRESVEYLSSNRYDKPTLTLMTCWPAGTDWKRVVVTAKL